MGRGNRQGKTAGNGRARGPQPQSVRSQQQRKQNQQQQPPTPASQKAQQKRSSNTDTATISSSTAQTKKRPLQPSQPSDKSPTTSAADTATRPKVAAATKKQKTGSTSTSDSSTSSSSPSSSPFPIKRVHNTYVPLTPYRSPSDDADSRETAAAVLQWLIAPLSVDTFYTHYFERRPFAILRHTQQPNTQHTKPQLITTRNTLPAILKAQLTTPNPPSRVEQLEEEIDVPPYDSSESAHYYSGWMGKSDVWSLLASKQHDIRYTRDVDVTSYRNHQRTTLNPPNSPRVALADIQRHFKAGCSIRFLAPHTYSPRLHTLLHQLDQALGMQSGANSYLTPAGTQGFSPHYDDVDVFILQTEGSKRWRLYAPTSANDVLPLESSRNYSQDELGCCVMDVWLKAGDFLYAPRGTVHQCVASDADDSLHVTVSTCLASTWGGYVRQFLMKAIDRALVDDVAMRQVLPRQWHTYMGEQHAAAAAAAEDDDTNSSEEVEEKRQAFMDHTLQLVERLLTREPDDSEEGEGSGGEVLPFDAAADEVALDYMHGRIKPLYTPTQQQRMHPSHTAPLQPTTLVRLCEADVLRLTASSDDGCVRVHHIAENAVSYKSVPLAHMDVDARLAPAVDVMRRRYPHWTRIAQLPFEQEEEEDEDDQEGAGGGVEELVHLCGVLFESGLLEATDDQSKADARIEEEEEGEEEMDEHEAKEAADPAGEEEEEEEEEKQ